MNNQTVLLGHCVHVGNVITEHCQAHALRFGYDGKSAYQSAVDGGYSGTEDQFNKQLADSARTYLVNLSKDYQPVALQAATDLSAGHPVILYIRVDDDEPLQTMIRVRDVGQAYLFTSASLEGQAEGGIAEIAQVQYAISKQTGNIQELRSKVLTSLLTKDAVQDSIADLDEKAGTLPVSQRQAAALRRLIEKLDGEVLKKDDILILNGNGVTNKTK
jgi:hypothetical protein